MGRRVRPRDGCTVMGGGVSLQRRDLPPRESPQAESDGRLQREAASVRVSSEWTGDVSQAVTVDLS